METSEIELKTSANEKLDIIPAESVAQRIEMSQKTDAIAHLSNMPDCKSILLHSSHTDSTLVKSDFFRTSYPSLNMVISHVDSVINRITPVSFEPPSYLDESLRKPTAEEHDTHSRILHGDPLMSKSFFVSFFFCLVHLTRDILKIIEESSRLHDKSCVRSVQMVLWTSNTRLTCYVELPAITARPTI